MFTSRSTRFREKYEKLIKINRANARLSNYIDTDLPQSLNRLIQPILDDFKIGTGSSFYSEWENRVKNMRNIVPGTDINLDNYLRRILRATLIKIIKENKVGNEAELMKMLQIQITRHVGSLLEIDPVLPNILEAHALSLIRAFMPKIAELTDALAKEQTEYAKLVKKTYLHKPVVISFDEPDNGIDSRAVIEQQIHSHIKSMVKESKELKELPAYINGQDLMILFLNFPVIANALMEDNKYIERIIESSKDKTAIRDLETFLRQLKEKNPEVCKKFVLAHLKIEKIENALIAMRERSSQKGAAVILSKILNLAAIRNLRQRQDLGHQLSKKELQDALEVLNKIIDLPEESVTIKVPDGDNKFWRVTRGQLLKLHATQNHSRFFKTESEASVITLLKELRVGVEALLGPIAVVKPQAVTPKTVEPEVIQTEAPMVETTIDASIEPQASDVVLLQAINPSAEAKLHAAAIEAGCLVKSDKKTGLALRGALLNPAIQDLREDTSPATIRTAISALEDECTKINSQGFFAPKKAIERLQKLKADLEQIVAPKQAPSMS